MVTPEPPLAPRNTSSLPPAFFGVNSLPERGPRPEPEPRPWCFASKGRVEKLASSRAHATDQQFRIGLHRIHHHRRRAVGADALHQFQGVFRVAVQVDDDDVVMLLQQPGHIVQAGRIAENSRTSAPRHFVRALATALRRSASGPINAIDRSSAPMESG